MRPSPASGAPSPWVSSFSGPCLCLLVLTLSARDRPPCARGSWRQLQTQPGWSLGPTCPHREHAHTLPRASEGKGPSPTLCPWRALEGKGHGGHRAGPRRQGDPDLDPDTTQTC